MKVLVLADDEQKEELLAMPVDDIIELEWIDTAGGMHLQKHYDACIDLLFENKGDRTAWLSSLPAHLVFVNAVTPTLQNIPGSFIRINGWNTFLKRPVLEAACNEPSARHDAEKLFTLFGRSIEWVPDIVGLISPRIVVSIINEAFIALEEGVSTAEQIDTAMKLGTNYPLGPFEWGKMIGLKNVYFLLETMSRHHGRYQPSLLLKQTALA